VRLEQRHQEQVRHADRSVVAAVRKRGALARNDRPKLVEQIRGDTSRIVNRSRHANHYAETKLLRNSEARDAQ
jgi:hypothetical protein